MVSPVRFVVPLLLAASCARAELHFTFQSQDSDLDGVKLHQLVFSDGDRQVKYAPPRDWQYFGDENRLRLVPPRGQTGEATVTRTKLQQPQKFDEVTMKRLAEEVIASAPPGARRVSMVSQEKDHLLIEGKETFLVVVKFELYGMTQMRSVMFLNRETDQIRFQLTCPEPSFAQLEKQFLASHFTWQNL
jgi:hypothetical protein